jgi:hypothetical protein
MPGLKPVVVGLTAAELQLLRSEIEGGGPSAFSKKTRVDRASRKIISALDLRVVYSPKRDKLKASGPAKDGFNEPRVELSVLIDGKQRLFINGNPVKATRTHVALVPVSTVN